MEREGTATPRLTASAASPLTKFWCTKGEESFGNLKSETNSECKRGPWVHTRAQMSQRKMQSGLVIPKSQLHLGDLGAWKRLEGESLQKLRTCWNSRCVRRHFCAEFADCTYMCCCNPPPRAQCRSWLKTEAECGKLRSETDASAARPLLASGPFISCPFFFSLAFRIQLGYFMLFDSTSDNIRVRENIANLECIESYKLGTLLASGYVFLHHPLEGSINWVRPSQHPILCQPSPLLLSFQTYWMEAPLMRKAEKEGKGARVPFFDELDDRPLCDWYLRCILFI